MSDVWSLWSMLRRKVQARVSFFASTPSPTPQLTALAPPATPALVQLITPPSRCVDRQNDLFLLCQSTNINICRPSHPSLPYRFITTSGQLFDCFYLAYHHPHSCTLPLVYISNLSTSYQPAHCPAYLLPRVNSTQTASQPSSQRPNTTVTQLQWPSFSPTTLPCQLRTFLHAQVHHQLVLFLRYRRNKGLSLPILGPCYDCPLHVCNSISSVSNLARFFAYRN